MPDLASIIVIVLAVAVGSAAGAYVAFRVMLHILDHWMR